MNDRKIANQSNTQEVPGVVWDEVVQQWLVAHEHDGKSVFYQHYSLINDAIAALKNLKSSEIRTTRTFRSIGK